MNPSMYGGEQALVAYAVVSYTACVIQMLIQGGGDGSQPLILKHYGAGVTLTACAASATRTT